MTIREQQPNAVPDAAAQGSRRHQGLLALGGMVGALGSASCCIVPLALFSLGATGAWIGNLSALMPYQPVFLIATFGFLGVGFWRVYRRPQAACDDDGFCARPASSLLTTIGLWSATALVAAALAFPYVAPRLLGI